MCRLGMSAFLALGVHLADLDSGLNGRLSGGGRGADRSAGLVPMPRLKLVAEYPHNPKLTLGLAGGWRHLAYLSSGFWSVPLLPPLDLEPVARDIIRLNSSIPAWLPRR